MIDRNARDMLAENIRHLVAGVISTDEFDDRAFDRSYDSAIFQIYIAGPWQLYSDFSPHKLRGANKLSREIKSIAARWVLFLKTDLPYEWPSSGVLSSLLWFPLHILTLGLTVRLRSHLFERHGDISVWPFVRASDLEEAKKHAPYLPSS